jgi:hypothetical protein
MPDRDVLQLLKLVKKSERKLQPRGFFRAKPRKARAEPEPAGTPAAVAGQTAVASSAIQPSVPPNPASAAPGAAAKPKDGKARAPASLPGSMVRPRLRPAKEAPVPQSSGAGPVPPAGEDGPRHPSELVPPPVAAQPPSRPVAAGPALSPPGPTKAAPGPAEQVPLAAVLAGGPSPAPAVLAPRPPGVGPESARVPRSGVLPGPLLAPPPPPPPATRPAPAPPRAPPAASPPHVLPGNPPDMRQNRPGAAQDRPATPAPRAADVSSGATPSLPGGGGLAPDFSTLPPSIAESLARLAGISKDGLGPKPGPKG